MKELKPGDMAFAEWKHGSLSGSKYKDHLLVLVELLAARGLARGEPMWKCYDVTVKRFCKIPAWWFITDPTSFKVTVL